MKAKCVLIQAYHRKLQTFFSAEIFHGHVCQIKLNRLYALYILLIILMIVFSSVDFSTSCTIQVLVH